MEDTARAGKPQKDVAQDEREGTKQGDDGEGQDRPANEGVVLV